MINPDIFGYIATSLNVVMMIPQVSHTWRTKQTRDLSLATLLIFSTASLLWIIYGIEKGAIPVIIANAVVGGLNILLILIKLKYSNTEKQEGHK